MWPRRAGKDTVSLNWTCREALLQPGNYWHLFPEQTQARKAIWNGINRDGQRIIDQSFPREVCESRHEQEMLIKLKSGSTWQLGGSDRYDALVGSNPRGVVFSEYAIANPRAYEFIRPILAENGGWAVFPYTPRGRNHGFELFEQLGAAQDAFAELLTCDDTGHMTAEALEIERAEMSDELFQQEYYCSWDFGIEGSYYASQMNQALKDGRICHVPYDRSRPVWVAMDLGLRDSTAIWFAQIGPGGELRLIDYEEHNGQQLKHYHDLLKDKGYSYADELILPHDAGHERLGMESIEVQLEGMGWRCRVLPREPSIFPGIESCRVSIGQAVFDEEKTRLGRAALSAYRKEYDDARNVFKNMPLHDWSSHGADSFRYLCRAWKGGMMEMGWRGAIDYSDLDRAVI